MKHDFSSPKSHPHYELPNHGRWDQVQVFSYIAQISYWYLIKNWFVTQKFWVDIKGHSQGRIDLIMKLLLCGICRCNKPNKSNSTCWAMLPPPPPDPEHPKQCQIADARLTQLCLHTTPPPPPTHIPSTQFHTDSMRLRLNKYLVLDRRSCRKLMEFLN